MQPEGRIDPESWIEVERLFHAAREQGVSVLESTDPALRRQVERLLAEDASGRILDREAADLLGELSGEDLFAGAGADLSGQTILHYEVAERLGEGGMGVVYKALDTRLNRFVALKFLPSQFRHDPELRRQLTDEARAASSLDHPNIVVVHEIGEWGDDLFIAMAYHEGVSLRERLAAQLPLAEALRIAIQTATGLARAHRQNICHGDIKPANIIVSSDGVTRIIDFGLAKSAAAGSPASGPLRGTPLYMSPEQAAGHAPDLRSDIWSLGVVLFEMLAARPPFRGQSPLELSASIRKDAPPPLRNFRQDTPPVLEASILRALQKDPARRFGDAEEFAGELAACLKTIEGPPAASPKLRRALALGAVGLLLTAATALWLFQQSRNRLHAREQTIPQIMRLLSQNKPLAASRLLRQASIVLPGDAGLEDLHRQIYRQAAVHSTPAGAAISIKDYLSPDDPWVALGTTPLPQASIPNGYLRWRLTKSGFATYEGAPPVLDMFGPVAQFDFQLEQSPAPHPEMVAVPAVRYENVIFSLGFVGPYELPTYSVDRFEVTNRDYQRFVDAGGYSRQEFWLHDFYWDNRRLLFSEAVSRMRDRSGNPGPSTWAAGRYPEGQGDFPVGGVSWYEAAAYAQFAGKSLPALAQWYNAAPSNLAREIIAVSNFSDAPAPVGRRQGIGPWGTFDMAGNVAEWCWNSSGMGGRYLLGGAFGTASAHYYEPETIPASYRGARAGIRLVRNSAPLPAASLAQKRPTTQDFSQAKPAGDAVFRIYRTLYSYDRSPLKPESEPLKHSAPGWRTEKISIDAAYARERLPLFLFLPHQARTPLQAVVYFPSARSLGAPSEPALADMHFIDFVIRNGRAVIYPIYKGTYERSAVPPGSDTVAARETLLQDSKDLGRVIDYLETRPDIDSNRIAFMGTSMGAALGVIFAGLEARFKAVIFLDGGFFSEKPLPGANQADFAPRIKAPVLLVASKFDWIFYGKDALLQLLGTPHTNKRAVTFDTVHDVSEQRTDLIREVLGWLDTHLGPARTPNNTSR